MPKNKKSIVKKEVKKKNFFSQIKWDESYVSLLIGFVVVVAIAVLGIFFVKSQKIGDISSVQLDPNIKIQEEKNANKENSQKTYVVKAGDNLWSISENFYKSGYNWVDIAKANNLKNPGVISAGNKLVIPNVQAKIITSKPMVQSIDVGKSIAGNSYKIEKGDSLWNISVRAYGDGYSWTKIAKANNLSRPDLIFSGNVIKIPR